MDRRGLALLQFLVKSFGADVVAGAAREIDPQKADPIKKPRGRPPKSRKHEEGDLRLLRQASEIWRESGAGDKPWPILEKVVVGAAKDAQKKSATERLYNRLKTMPLSELLRNNLLDFAVANDPERRNRLRNIENMGRALLPTHASSVSSQVLMSMNFGEGTFSKVLPNLDPISSSLAEKMVDTRGTRLSILASMLSGSDKISDDQARSEIQVLADIVEKCDVYKELMNTL